MNLSLEGKNALVGGSSKGIGNASAIELSKLGATITLVSRSEENLRDALGLLDSSHGQEHGYLVLDHAHPGKVKEKLSAHLATGKHYQILINNSGGPKGGLILEADELEFRQAFNNHLICNHIIAQALIPGMKASGYGRIINIISTSVKQPIPYLGVSNTTRGAVASWSKTLATELAPTGITVNNVLPGSTKTERLTYAIEARARKENIGVQQASAEWMSRIPMGRFAEAYEVANAVAFLASPAAGYITGASLPVDGGTIQSL